MIFVCLQFTACLLNIRSVYVSCKTNEARCHCAFISIFGAMLYRPVNSIEQSERSSPEGLARLLWEQEVPGSNPGAPTISHRDTEYAEIFLGVLRVSMV